MISVVIPTMWKVPWFPDFLDKILEHDCVDEVLLINNNVPETPERYIRGLPDHFIMMNQKTNIGVNPAWNLGVATAKNDLVFIINDDVVFDLGVFKKVFNVYMEDNYFGCAGINPGDSNFEYGRRMPYKNGKIELWPWVEPFPEDRQGARFGFGTLFAVTKQWWEPIPNGLTFLFGDDWAFETCLIRGLNNYLINDCFYRTESAQTCGTLDVFKDRGPEYVEMFDREQDIFLRSLGWFYSLSKWNIFGEKR